MFEPLQHGVAQLRVRTAYQGHSVSNVFHFRQTRSGRRPANYQALADAVADWWVNGIGGVNPPAAYQGGDSSMEGADLRAVIRGISSEVSLFVAQFLVSLFFTLEPPMPANCTKALEWTTGRAGHAGHGRTYIPWLSRQFLDPARESSLDRFSAEAMVRTWSSLFDLLESLDTLHSAFRLCIAHRSPIGSPDDDDSWSTIVTGCRFASLTMDSQRGRLRSHRV